MQSDDKNEGIAYLLTHYDETIGIFLFLNEQGSKNKAQIEQEFLVVGLPTENLDNSLFGLINYGLVNVNEGLFSLTPQGIKIANNIIKLTNKLK